VGSPHELLPEGMGLRVWKARHPPGYSGRADEDEVAHALLGVADRRQMNGSCPSVRGIGPAQPKRTLWRTCTLAVAILVLSAACTSGASPERSPDRVVKRGSEQELRKELQRALESAREEGDFPGVQAAVVLPDGSLWTGADGEVQLGSGKQVTTKTRFAIASITKAFTATTILRLADRGVLSLDDRLSEWLPNIRGGGGISIRQLLSHTSGLAVDVESDPAPAHLPRVCSPGACLSYSNLGYELAGAIVEEATHSSLAQAYHAELLDELGLRSTFLPSEEDADGQMAVGHDDTGVLDPADEEAARTDASGDLGPAGSGGLISTAEEVARFAAALYGGGLLGKESLAAMLNFDVSANLPGSDECWARGLGVVRVPSAGGRETWGHAGVLFGFTSAVRYYPAYGVTVAAMVNMRDSSPGSQGIENALGAIALEHAPVIHPEVGRGTCNTDVYAIRADGTGLARLTEDPATEWGSVAFSPDGTRVLFASNRTGDDELFVMNADGTGVEQITDSPGIDGMPSWSPNGRRIAFVSMRSGARAIYTAPPDGSSVVMLTEGILATWSPDGAAIAYSREQGGSDLDLWLMGDDGSNQRRLTDRDGDELWPTWSPDGTKIAFTSDGVLCIVGVEGGDVTELDLGTEASIDPDMFGFSGVEFASWSATGRIVFMSDGDLWTVRPNGSNPVRLGGSPGRDYAPAWSPDGQWVAFTGSRWEQP
jgi:CubicO group peptidase (beta-lactamase class C family)